ncbi:MAG: ribonucleotide reductase N-terminal alpha domain-containing protein, partial [Chloroflexota bacterium]
MVDRNRVAKMVFSAAESMGMADRETVEALAGQVIARLEQQPAEREPQEQPFPGMETLVSMAAPKRKPVLSSEIENILKEILARKEAEPREDKLNMESTVIKPVTKSNGAVELTENARHVLERRYLQKDKEGNVIEAPSELLRRVASAIAAAELGYNPAADIGFWEEEFFNMMASLKFLPNSPTLMNAGRELG